MGYRRLTREAFTATAEEVKTTGRGETSFAGIQRQKEGKGLDPLVDPKGFDLIRFSRPRYEQQEDGSLLLTSGVPMLIETLADTTGSMGGNVSLLFEVLPTTYNLLAGSARAVLGRYDTQIINAIFGDVVDDYVLYRSQAEMDVEIAKQLTLMVPERAGGDTTEDPDYGIFAAAYLTNAHINKYGLKSYHFLVTDAPCRERIDRKNLIRVFGERVFEKVKENGHTISEGQLPTTKETVRELEKRAHTFVLHVGGRWTSHWSGIYGSSHVVVIPHVGFLPYVQAAIIGLTEGTLDLQSLKEYLISEGCDSSNAQTIVRAVAGIPLATQTLVSNYKKIPLKGTLFAQKGDLWPISETGKKPVEAKKPKPVKEEDDAWL